MDTASYKQKLNQFNSTDKYRRELSFLIQLLGNVSNDTVLDFGCGTTYAMSHIQARRVYGIDKVKHNDHPYFLDTLKRKFDHVYFLHSFAHVENIADVLIDLRYRIRETITIITPNRKFLEANPKPNYVPDPTVLKHYSLDELIHLLQSTGWFIGAKGQFGNYSAGQNERLFIQGHRI